MSEHPHASVLARAGTGRARLIALMNEAVPEPPPPPPMTDAEFFAAKPARNYRVRPWQRADWPNPDLRYEPVRVPVCSIVVRTPHGPVARYRPAAVGEAPILDTDAGAEALIAAISRPA